MSDEPRAIYRLDIEMTFIGPIPERYNPAAPEVTQAQFAAVEAAKKVLEEHGFEIAGTGHGSLRLGTHLPSEIS